MPTVVKDEGSGLQKVLLKSPNGHSAEVFLYGGHVTSWKNEKGEELLFVSGKAVYKPPKAIRGGIPVCFPQFGGFGPLDQHGFARNRVWTIDSSDEQDDPAIVDLLLKPSEDDIKLWNTNIFELRMRVSIGSQGELTSALQVSNMDTKPITFTFALHTYFAVSDVSEVRVEGLETLDYLDNLKDKQRFTEQGDSVTFDQEVDRIYLSSPPKIAIVDHSKKRTFVIKKEGLPDAVVWNPWMAKAKAMADFGDDEYKRMVCVEAAAIEKPITLKPGDRPWRAIQELSLQ
eukprot:TRINITY_DN1321_c0_g1_i1.p1 TRINITY_DN1321_c0_g1~~TRINITY_DN1321_c0_g1_i1.p1  ORF type:complete len:287 (-),score=65.54 TRINITY_DN1321_c0_g1_i1:556-1416(-)